MNVEFGDKTYELPKWTMKLAKLQDEVESETTNEMLYKKSYDFVKVIFPKDDLAELLDGKTLETVDLLKLNEVYKITCAKYIDALQETSLELTANKFDRLSEMLDVAERAAKLSETMRD